MNITIKKTIGLCFKFCILSICICLFYGCLSDKNNDQKVISVAVNNNNLEQNQNKKNTLLTIRVAVSSMLSPIETRVIYQELFQHMSKKLGYDIEFIQRKSYQEVNDLLIQNKVDLALICSGAYIEDDLKGHAKILVVPLNNKKPYYKSYIIVNSESGIKKLSDLEHKRFAFTDPLSNSGTLYAKYLLKKMGKTPEKYFSKTIYSYGHDISMQLVAKGIVDGASVDALIYNYNKVFYPEKIKYLSIIDSSADFGIPPLVIPNELDENVETKLRDFFLNIHKDSVGIKILNKLLIDGFAIGYDSSYNSIRLMNKTLKE